MSTRSTKGMYKENGLSVHIYHEMHDDRIYMEIGDNGQSYSGVSIVLPDEIGQKFAEAIERIEPAPTKEKLNG